MLWFTHHWLLKTFYIYNKQFKSNLVSKFTQLNVVLQFKFLCLHTWWFTEKKKWLTKQWLVNQLPMNCLRHLLEFHLKIRSRLTQWFLIFKDVVIVDHKYVSFLCTILIDNKNIHQNTQIYFINEHIYFKQCLFPPHQVNNTKARPMRLVIAQV